MSTDLGRALSQISEIHGHLTRAEVYRGLGPAPVAFSGALALAAAAAEPRLVGSNPGLRFVWYWVVVALVAAAAAASVIAYNYVRREDDFARRRTRRVVAQFVPCLAAGIGVTAGLVHLDPRFSLLLPGIWSVLFGLGIFAARPHLPHAIGWVALFYLLAGMLLLWAPPALLGWGMAIVFGLGQLATALVLHSNVERAQS
jgi:hypothetical protein